MQVRWKEIIEGINHTADRYLVAVSGGIDSMFMLEFFYKNCRQPFRVAHFNHGLRPEAAAAEEAFVGSWCERRDIAFHVGRGDPDAMRAASSLEAEARNQRYAYLDGLIDEGELIVTAHHANDQLENVLMRLMRGHPTDQLRMQARVGDRYRPFLMVPRAEIERQAKNRGIEWMEDESNLDIVHERNWMRHVIIPQLMERRNILKTIVFNEREPQDDNVPSAPLHR